VLVWRSDEWLKGLEFEMFGPMMTGPGCVCELESDPRGCPSHFCAAVTKHLSLCGLKTIEDCLEDWAWLVLGWEKFVLWFWRLGSPR
jgi:hypothetical protein